MDGGNLLSGGIETLNAIKDCLNNLHGCQLSYSNLISEEEKLEKSIQNEEKVTSDEIMSTTKKRKQEIEEAFDQQTDKVHSRIKKIKEKRDKRKSKKMSERISEETAGLRDENSRLKLDAKTILHQKHIPRYCNTGLFYALYYPAHFEDLLIILLTLILILFAVPCGIYFLLLPKERILYLILIYIATVIVFGGLYLLIGNHTKDKHPEEIKQIKGLRECRRVNFKKINVIRRNIRKDRDESSYGLENFDEELSRLYKQEEDIANQKKEALLQFNNTTSRAIADDIKNSHEGKLNGLKADYQSACAEASKAEDMVKTLSIQLAGEYEPYIGKDLMTIESLDALINIIEAGNAATISEAIAFHRQNVK